MDKVSEYGSAVLWLSHSLGKDNVNVQRLSFLWSDAIILVGDIDEDSSFGGRRYTPDPDLASHYGDRFIQPEELDMKNRDVLKLRLDQMSALVQMLKQ